MKKIFNEPKLHIVYMDCDDIVCTSDPNYLGNDENTEAGARVRRNAIWDDSE